MSAKKKPQQVLNECTKCGCSILVKDAQAHVEYCGKSFEASKISFLKPKAALMGYLTNVEKVMEYIPPDAVGWTRSYSVLINHQTMDLLQIKPRAPIRLTVNEKSIIGIAWPCKEVGALKIATSSNIFHPDSLCLLEVIHNFSTVERLCLSINNKRFSTDKIFLEFLESYLSNCFVEPGLTISLHYYGILVEFQPVLSLDDKMLNLNLDEGEIQTIVLQTTNNLSISLLHESEALQKVDRMASFNSIGGLRSVKKAIKDFILEPFMSQKLCCSILMWGLPGIGKTKILTALAEGLGSKCFYFESMDEFNERSSLIPTNCIVILDWSGVDKTHKAYSHLIQLLKSKKPAAVILSVSELDGVDLSVRVHFPVEVEVEVPNESERLEILQSIGGSISSTFLPQLAKTTHGFTGGDLELLIRRASNTKGDNEENRLETARKLIRPSGIREKILELPDVKWSDIGGNEELKEEIQQAVIWPQTHKETFKRFGIDPPSGILLYGPPGCSKTLVAQALANEAKMNFLSVKGPELFSKWVGDSEKAIRKLFSRARQVAPTIVFFDEIDAVGASRGSEKSSGVSDRVLAQLLTELDGLEKNSGVILLAATNRPDQLDSALLRPGRLDRAIHVGLPSPSTRRAILALKMSKMPIDEEVDVEKLIDKTGGYSGAEIVAVVQHAGLVAMREDMNGFVEWKHFEEALKAIVPRTEQELLEIYRQFQIGVVTQ